VQEKFSRGKELSRIWEDIQRNMYKFSRNPLSIVGLVLVCMTVFIAIFAPFISPHPESAGKYVNFYETSKPPSRTHPFGTDRFGRDVLTRTLYGYRYSLGMAAMVISIMVPIGIVLGLLAGYYRNSWVDTLIMRTTDIFIAVPPLLLALAVCSVLTPSIFNAMLAICVAWWPWYARMLYEITCSLKNEFFVQAAELTGASTTHILFREIIPNCLAPILTKMSLDVGWVILIGSALSFVGLGAQPPTPDLGTLVADASNYLPDLWWEAVFPAFAIMLIVLAFNLFGDGIADMLGEEKGG
jgi:peptide/nickel transport system permease protein